MCKKNICRGILRWDGQRQAIDPPPYKISRGVDFHLAKATSCGLGSSYMSLETPTKRRGTVRIDWTALYGAYHQFGKSVPKRNLANYQDNIRTGSLSSIQVFSEAFGKYATIIRLLWAESNIKGTWNK